MKFSVSSNDLLKRLMAASGVIKTNTVMPILEDFLFTLKGNQLTVLASDLETSISTSLDVAGAEDGEIAIPSRLLLDALKTLPNVPLDFVLNEGANLMEMNSVNGVYKFAVEGSEGFPRIVEPIDFQEVTVSSDIVLDAINKTLFAVANDDMRPAMSGVKFELNPEGITFVATDAHKLVKYQVNESQDVQEAAFTMPRKALALLKGNLTSGTEVLIQYNDSNAYFHYDNIHLICRLIDEPYPNYSGVIPHENPYALLVNRDEFYSSLKRIGIFASKSSHQVALHIADGNIMITATDLDFNNEAKEEINCTYEGDPMDISFNGRFLMEIVNALDSEEIKITLSTHKRPALVYPVDADNSIEVLMLIMPIMPEREA